MQADKDLGSQQHQLASMKYDLRITNLARFLYRKVTSDELRVASSDDAISPSSPQGKPTLLDVGAGNGLFLKFFKAHGFKVAGYELEKELVANMQKDPALKGDMIEQGDITKMKGKEEYDVVIASDVIEHIEDDVKAIQGLWSFVAPGGLLLITVPGHSALYGKRDEMWGHFRRYDKDILLERIRSAISNYQSPISKLHSQNTNTPPPSGTPLSGENNPPLRGESQKGGGSYDIAFATQWNFVGFFVYGFYEKILHKSINEKMRYSDSLPSKIVRFILDSILKLEEKIGGVPLGLTQVVGVRKLKGKT